MKQVLNKLIVNTIGAGFFGRFIRTKGAGLLATTSIGITALLSWIIGYKVITEDTIIYTGLIGRWIKSGILSISMGIRIDSITAMMLILVTTVSWLVHMYSTGYMSEDPHVPRFMAYLSLFTFFISIIYYTFGATDYSTIFALASSAKYETTILLVTLAASLTVFYSFYLIYLAFINTPNFSFSHFSHSHEPVLSRMFPLAFFALPSHPSPWDSEFIPSSVKLLPLSFLLFSFANLVMQPIASTVFTSAITKALLYYKLHYYCAHLLSLQRFFTLLATTGVIFSAAYSLFLYNRVSFGSLSPYLSLACYLFISVILY